MSRGGRTVSSERAVHSRPIAHDVSGGGATDDPVPQRPVSSGGQRVAGSELDHKDGARPEVRPVSRGGSGVVGMEPSEPTVLGGRFTSDARDSADGDVKGISSSPVPPSTIDAVAEPTSVDPAHEVDAGDSSSEDEEWMNSLR